MFAEDDSAGFELVTVRSGARSLRSRQFGEVFHPVIGPIAEARALHVRQQRLVERAAEGMAAAEPFVIWDVGLGAAANAIAALEALRGLGSDVKVELHSVDHTAAPLIFALEHAEELGYLARFVDQARELLASGVTRCGAVTWRFHEADFCELVKTAELPAPHAILYDPYSPRANPRLWTLEHFRHLRVLLHPTVPCLLTNYTRSTAVRVTLLLAGFFVGRGDATGEKDETTIAANALELLPEPLDASWLARVRRSASAAPLRAGGDAAGPIDRDAWRELLTHPQFAGVKE